MPNKVYTSLRLQRSTAEELKKLKMGKESDDEVLIRLIEAIKLLQLVQSATNK
jgi:predicted CopG family antitoxin